MNFLHGNDKKRIKSALNDKKTKWSKINNSRSNLWRDKLQLKNGTTNDKISVKKCLYDKKRQIVLSFVIILSFLGG